MRTAKNMYGYDTVVSSDEYKFLMQLKNCHKVKESELSPYYQELADKLYGKSLLQRTVNNDEVKYISLQ